jgi:phage tail-like protein
MAELLGAPPVAFHFTVSFGAMPPAVDGSFQEVSGIAPEMETEAVPEGGENRFVHQLPKAVKNPKLTLKRGVAGLDSPLVSWCRAVLEGGLVNPIVPKVLHVFLLDGAGVPLRAWSFANAYPVRWEVEAFNSTKNEVALEKIELSYAYSKREV